jgi:hypothetical protein
VGVVGLLTHQLHGMVQAPIPSPLTTGRTLVFWLSGLPIAHAILNALVPGLPSPQCDNLHVRKPKPPPTVRIHLRFLPLPYHASWAVPDVRS